MSTTTKAAHTPTQRAVDAIVAMHDSRQRKHDCPGFDCSTCSLHADESRMSEIIDRETAAPVMLEALEGFISDAYVDDTLCGWCGYRTEIGHGRIHNAVCRVGKAEAAIQKARGGE